MVPDLTRAPSRPRHLAARYAAQFADESIARAYHTRPPYPAELFEILAGLQPAGPRTILDLGCGTGDIALGLAGRAERIDAVDPSPAMLRVARARPGADHPSLRWACATAEACALDGPYSLVVAAESFHWMDWAAVCARVAGALRSHAFLALVRGRTLQDTAWSAGLAELIPRYSTNQEYQPYDIVEELTRRRLFTEVGRRVTAFVPFEQPIDDYVESFHTRHGFSRERMTCAAAADFDSALRRLVARHASDGVVRGQVRASVVWGFPVRPTTPEAG